MKIVYHRRLGLFSSRGHRSTTILDYTRGIDHHRRQPPSLTDIIGCHRRRYPDAACIGRDCQPTPPRAIVADRRHLGRSSPPRVTAGHRCETTCAGRDYSRHVGTCLSPTSSTGHIDRHVLSAICHDSSRSVGTRVLLYRLTTGLGSSSL